MHGNAVAYVAAGVALALAAALIVRVLLKRPPTPEEIERNRRLSINRAGKMADATIIDFSGASITFSYSVRGVEYTATQDISTLHDRIPEGEFSIDGGAGVKYDPRNPANSIVVCESWTGLRAVGSKLERT